jgi:hypothetical protein
MVGLSRYFGDGASALTHKRLKRREKQWPAACFY